MTHAEETQGSQWELSYKQPVVVKMRPLSVHTQGDQHSCKHSSFPRALRRIDNWNSDQVNGAAYHAVAVNLIPGEALGTGFYNDR